MIGQPVLSSRWLISQQLLKVIRVFFSYLVLFILFLLFLFLFIFVLLGRKNCRKNCGKKLSQSHDSAEYQFFIFLLHTIRQKGGFYKVEPFHDGAAELLGDVVDYFLVES